MDLFGFDLNRLQVVAPNAVTDLGGLLGGAGGAIGNAFSGVAHSELAQALWKPVSYILPKVRIAPEHSAGRPVQTFRAGVQPVSMPQAQPAFWNAHAEVEGGALMIVGGLALIGVLLAVRR